MSASLVAGMSSSFWEAHFGSSSLWNMQMFAQVCFCISLMMLPPLPRGKPMWFEGTRILEQMALPRFSLSLVFPCNWKNASNVGETPSLATTSHYFALQIQFISTFNSLTTHLFAHSKNHISNKTSNLKTWFSYTFNMTQMHMHENHREKAFMCKNISCTTISGLNNSLPSTIDIWN